jgi:hypothetical protein
MIEARASYWGRAHEELQISRGLRDLAKRLNGVPAAFVLTRTARLFGHAQAKRASLPPAKT